jgi:predicted RNA-binding Zn-ribbon protein involved in translation (DUF1610 family)
MRLEGSPAPGCPRCGDQTLWRIGRSFVTGELYGYCRLCKHEWDIPEQNVYRCDDPEGDWIKDQEEASRDR